MTYPKIRSAILLSLIVLFVSSASGQITQPTGVITHIIKTAGFNDTSLYSTLASEDILAVHQYVDGFGRPLEKIYVAASPASGKDIIQFNTYDALGHSTQKYLPFAYTAAASPYQDISTAITNQASFYNGTAKVANDTKPWAQTEIEESPMQRLLKQGNVGDGFQTNQNYKSVTYRPNSAGLGGIDGFIQIWLPGATTSSSTYSSNDLDVMEGTDENGVKTMVFTDHIGHVVLKRQEADETINSLFYTYFDTYYVYDQMGNLSYIIPPKAVVKMGLTSWDVTNAPELIYHYTYDAKNRVIIKKIPNQADMYIVYDPLDRPIMVQDGNLRASNNWYFTKYDTQGRPVVEGVYTDATHTTFNDGTSSDMLVYIWSFTSGIKGFIVHAFVERINSTFGYNDGTCGFPFTTTGVEDRIYFYYDDYDFDYDGTPDFSYSTQSMSGEMGSASRVRGLPTGVKKRIVGTSTWLVTATFYDQWGHPIQTVSNSELKSSATDLTTQVADMAGRVKLSRIYKSHSLGSGFSITVNRTYTYDKMDRITQVKQKNNSEAEVIVGHYEYNAIGQLVDKSLHSTNSGSTYLQSVDFRYNIRGQLTSINNATLSNDGGVTNDETNDLFGMELFYDQTDAIGNSANYTGMLSGAKWKAVPPSGGSTDERAYVYAYDKLNRLTSATYKEYNTGSSNWTQHVNGFNEAMSYDWNGNILALTRNAYISGNVEQIDDLVYSYGSGTDNNQLQDVVDNSTSAYSSLGFNYGSSSGYSYDANGNLTSDPKKTTTITYNEYNRPVSIVSSGTTSVSYEYDGSGQRISKTIHSGFITKQLFYVDGFVFDESYAISYFQMPEGRNRPGVSAYVYEYYISDQQGNVRISFEDNGSGTAVARQENSYYPFGMIMPNSYTPTLPNTQLYNGGSDWQDDYGINTIDQYYSTLSREYDPVLGRFNSVDPMADSVVSFSIYQYSMNNPVNFNDPSGNLSQKDNGFIQFWQTLTDYVSNGQGFSIDDIQDANGSHNAFTFSNDDDENGGGVAFAWDTNATSQNQFYDQTIEEIVRSYIKQGHDALEFKEQDKYYLAAVNKIVTSYPQAFFDLTGAYAFVNNTLHDYGLNFFSGPDYNKYGQMGYTFDFSKESLDAFAYNTNLSSRSGYQFNFGYIVESIYHEYIHAYQIMGLYGFSNMCNESSDPVHAEREFQAYYLQSRNSSLPSMGVNNISLSYSFAMQREYPYMYSGAQSAYAGVYYFMSLYISFHP